jgi:hypothetical protein
MTQRVYAASWGLTWWVSPSWGLPASLSALLTLNDTLTSRLDGGGDWVAVGMGRWCRVCVPCYHYSGI